MIAKIQFIKSAVYPQDYPDLGIPEVAFVGRSNAGKSSLLNALAGTNIAKVSRKPGKTRLLNFFKWDETHALVDIPGYGFARRSKIEQDEWKEMIESYLHGRETLNGLVLVFDVRRRWSDEEEALLEWWEPYGKPLILALNKTDQLNQKERALKEREFAPLKDRLEIHWVATQGKKPPHNGVDALRRAVFERIVQMRS